MPWRTKTLQGLGAATAILAICLGAPGAAAFERAMPASISPERAIHVSVADVTRPPIGWVEFCTENPAECASAPSKPRDVVLSAKTWKDLVRVNQWVNETIRPVTDLDHWGVVEKWSYP